MNCIDGTSEPVKGKAISLDEGGYTIERVKHSAQRLNEQFVQQQCADDECLFELEKELRKDKGSFNKVCKLSPTSYRFRVVDVQERDIRNRSNTRVGDAFGYVET